MQTVLRSRLVVIAALVAGALIAAAAFAMALPARATPSADIEIVSITAQCGPGGVSGTIRVRNLTNDAVTDKVPLLLAQHIPPALGAEPMFVPTGAETDVQVSLGAHQTANFSYGPLSTAGVDDEANSLRVEVDTEERPDLNPEKSDSFPPCPGQQVKPTPTRTHTPPAKATATPTKTKTPKKQATATPTKTNTPKKQATATPTNTNVPKKDATSTPTNTKVPPTSTPTNTPISQVSPTVFPPSQNIPGDVNCDGKVNSRDALMILQLNAGLKNILPCIKNADVNGDNRINALDALLILQFEAGLIDHF